MGRSNPLGSDASSAHASLTAASPEASRLGACWPDGSNTTAMRLGAGDDVELDVRVLSTDKTIAIANISSDEDRDTEQKTAGETPQPPHWIRFLILASNLILLKLNIGTLFCLILCRLTIWL